MRTKEELLLLPVWTYQDIMDYLPIKSKTTAIKVKQRAIDEYQGSVPYGSNYVKTNSVLAMYGTSREQELLLIKKESNHEENI